MSSRMDEVFVVREAPKKPTIPLSPQQKEKLEVAIHADRGAPMSVTARNYIISKKGSKVVASLDPQQDDPRTNAAANDGTLPMELVWDPTSPDTDDGSKGAWVESNQFGKEEF